MRLLPSSPGRGGHSPLRARLARTINRCTYQVVTTNHRGGTRAYPDDDLTKVGIRDRSAHKIQRGLPTCSCYYVSSWGAIWLRPMPFRRDVAEA
jgi:hypothetical protein